MSGSAHPRLVEYGAIAAIALSMVLLGCTATPPASTTSTPVSPGSASVASSESAPPPAQEPTSAPTPAPTKPELTLEQRKAIAWETAAQEDKAMVEAEKKYPTNLGNGGSMANVEKNAAYVNTLDEKYKAAIVKKYHITRDQMLDIIVQAAEENWPLPEPPDMSNMP
jgi:hypothetical protein